MTPLQHQLGIVTPNGLFFERHHAGTPDIDPDQHQLVIHGMVRQPLKFSHERPDALPGAVADHLPGVLGQRADRLDQGGVDHGAAVAWTALLRAMDRHRGRDLLDEAGIDPAAKWVLFEGADGASHARSIPIEKVMADTLLGLGPRTASGCGRSRAIRCVLIPGWEGNVSVKWLRRIELADQPWHLRSETARYTDPMPEGKWRQFSFVMECKSVITRPSGGMTLAGPGIYPIEGFAWSATAPSRRST